MATETEKQEVKLKSRVLYFAHTDIVALRQSIDDWLLENPKYGVKSQQTIITTARVDGEVRDTIITVVVVRWLPLMNDNLQRTNGRG